MALTTADLVKDILGDNYGPDRSGSLPSLTPFIDAASVILGRVVACAVAKGVTLSSVEQEMIERWMAAHYYTVNDALYTSRTTAGASGSFTPRSYKDEAIGLDASGCLAMILSKDKRRVSAKWLGKSDAEKLTYDDRN